MRVGGVMVCVWGSSSSNVLGCPHFFPRHARPRDHAELTHRDKGFKPDGMLLMSADRLVNRSFRSFGIRGEVASEEGGGALLTPPRGAEPRWAAGWGGLGLTLRTRGRPCNCRCCSPSCTHLSCYNIFKPFIISERYDDENEAYSLPIRPLGLLRPRLGSVCTGSASVQRLRW